MRLPFVSCDTLSIWIAAGGCGAMLDVDWNGPITEEYALIESFKLLLAFQLFCL